MSVLAFHHCCFFFCRSRGGMGLQDCGGGPYGMVETCHCSTGELLKQRDNSGRELITPHSQNRALACHSPQKGSPLPYFLSASLCPCFHVAVCHTAPCCMINTEWKSAGAVRRCLNMKLAITSQENLQCDINE